MSYGMLATQVTGLTDVTHPLALRISVTSHGRSAGRRQVYKD
jgi:hypothetical protein